MIVLDTNVLSEVLRPAPAARVLAWLGSLETLTTFTTTITQAEILYGVERLAVGKRRAMLVAAIESVFREEFRDRILPFDEDAARAYAKIVVARESAGRPVSQWDAMIAAIAQTRGASVATRNTADFEGCGVRLVDPWQ